MGVYETIHWCLVLLRNTNKCLFLILIIWRTDCNVYVTRKEQCQLYFKPHGAGVRFRSPFWRPRGKPAPSGSPGWRSRSPPARWAWNACTPSSSGPTACPWSQRRCSTAAASSGTAPAAPAPARLSTQTGQSQKWVKVSTDPQLGSKCPFPVPWQSTGSDDLRNRSEEKKLSSI